MKKNNKGFTLAELLIVVAIIAVLTAIAIPVFTNQLEKSREATDMANVRSAYAEVMTQYLEDGAAHSMSVSAQQGVDGWQTSPQPYLTTQIEGKENSLSFDAKKKGNNYAVAINVDATTGAVTVAVN
ncbi:MAG: prepilin-type N-terminal cleavage/methylation domain-containing protein [Oscillospiraceae bacterium]|nr:prepilin-type N-terminal cleavage/methylation domain-containing protein [Oscillospiraceae bacterium]